MYGLIKSLKGNWGLTGDSTKQGIVQDMNRISYASFISHLRRVNLPMDASLKIRAPHQLNGSQWGVMCPCESPDGASIGLLKNMAILTKISPYIDTVHIEKAINMMFTFTERPFTSESVRIELNNNFYGWLDDAYKPNEFVDYIRLLRRCGRINSMISVVWSIFENTINIMCGPSRCCRPLIHDVKKLQAHMHTKGGDNLPDWKEAVFGKRKQDTTEFISRGLILDDVDVENKISNIIAQLKEESGFVEYIDIEESNTCLIKFDIKDKDASHYEIHPTTMFSAYTATIPLSNHNQAPRNIFSGAQGKQAIGVYATNWPHRIETMSSILHYPQKPLVATRYAKYLNVDTLPNGENLIVAIATYTGYNQEDSIIINKHSIDRGLFNISYFKSHIGEEEDMKNGDYIHINNPNQVHGCEITKFANYKKLDDQGLPIVNEYIKEGDAYLGKVMYNAATGTNISKCDIAGKTMEGFIDKVVVYTRGKGTDKKRVAKIRIRKPRMPELGDKMGSRHGQKGVIGAILPQEMMPFNKDGIVPDIIINPHAFPSRMTIAHLLECVLAKAGTCKGCTFDATPFEQNDFESVYNMLETKYKMDRYGDELLYNGITGEQIETKIFFGPTYYYRLKHMVADKLNYRQGGKIVSMTRQPPKGRGNDGGLRIGEMEVNAILGHGVAAFMKETMMERSDKFVNGGLNMPYTFKLFNQELEAMSLGTIMEVGTENEMFNQDQSSSDYEDFDYKDNADEQSDDNDDDNDDDDDENADFREILKKKKEKNVNASRVSPPTSPKTRDEKNILHAISDFFENRK